MSKPKLISSYVHFLYHNNYSLLPYIYFIATNNFILFLNFLGACELMNVVWSFLTDPGPPILAFFVFCLLSYLVKTHF